MLDKVAETLIEALKQALAGSGEQRLYKSGKLEGLFTSRAGPSGEAAQRALQEGLLETVRTEAKGKASIEWVRISSRGVEFLHEHESPVRVLEELQGLLQVTKEGVPAWLGRIQHDLRETGDRLVESVQQMSQRLEALGQRVEESLRRADLSRLRLPPGAAAVSWARDALAYLERRRDNGATGHCPLPELFDALHERHADLSIPAFLEGLRRLHDHRALQLLPFSGAPDQLPEPEYALLDGASVLYYAAR